MRVSLAFPPSICLPNQLYYSLPVLAGVVRRAGHEVVGAVDLNLAAADMLLTEERADRYLTMAHEMVEGGTSLAKLTGLRAILDASEEKVRDGERCKKILRDREAYYEQELFRHAFWTVDDALAFYYQFDPVISPFRETFAADVLERQRSDPWTPMRDLYEEGLLDEVLAGDPEFVGMTIAFPEQSAETFRLARKLRERRPDLHLALGGPLLNCRTDSWLEGGWAFDFFDSIVLGDGAVAMVELLEALEGHRGLDRVTNLVWREDNGRVRRNTERPVLDDLDALPLPDFSAIDMHRAFTPLPIYPLQISRGCYWGRCAFCSIGWRENYRMVSEDTIRNLVHDLGNTYGARYIGTQDSSVPPRGARMLAEAISAEGLDIHWEGGMKFTPQFLDKEYCQALGRGGCRSLKMGFESANQTVLDLMDKGYQLTDLEKMLANLREAGVSVEMLWFVGFPTETKPQIMETLRWLFDRRQLFGLTAFVGDYQLHPDTDVYEDPGRFGVRITGQENGYCTYEIEKGVSQEQLAVIKDLLSCNNNRTLVCNGSHLPHLAEGGLDLSGLERPMRIPPEAVAACQD